MAPRVRMRYLQPMLSSFRQIAPVVQENFGIYAQATITVSKRLFHRDCMNLQSEAIRLPTGQKTDRSVSKLPDVCGRNSRNRAPSTGRLPPTPRPMQAYNAQTPIQFGPPPAASPKIPARNKVKLNARRRPTTSDAVPQKEAPMQRPRKSARVVYLTSVSLTPNSADSWGRVRATPFIDR